MNEKGGGEAGEKKGGGEARGGGRAEEFGGLTFCSDGAKPCKSAVSTCTLCTLGSFIVEVGGGWLSGGVLGDFDFFFLHVCEWM